MTDEVRTRAAASPPVDGEKRYADPYGLYRRWFDAWEDAGEETAPGSLGSAEFGELWRRWFEGTVKGLGGRSGAALPGSSLAPLWEQMAEDVRKEMLSSGEGLPEDPVRVFLRWYNATNETWSRVADDLLKSEEALEANRRFLESYSRSYRELRRASEEGLKNLQLPTRSDVARVARLVVGVEEKVDRIEEAFGEFVYGDSGARGGRGAVSDLQERMNRLESKVDRILAALEKGG